MDVLTAEYPKVAVEIRSFPVPTKRQGLTLVRPLLALDGTLAFQGLAGMRSHRKNSGGDDIGPGSNSI